MISTQDAFRKFRSRLELNQKEQDDASRRQKEIREVMDDAFDIDHDFLTGSYRRWTKTKPLKDVDIFCVLGAKERHYRDKPPATLLSAVESALAKKYGSDKVSKQRRSCTVEFGVTPVDDRTDYKVMSFDVVPAFAKEDHYEIPDTATSSGWTETNPTIHFDKAVEAQEAYSGEWKGLVRMMKKWNAQRDKPIKPSFLIEVMALEILLPPWGGDYRREMQAFFASLADRIHETWADPAGLGPPVSDSMDAQKVQQARNELRAAERQAAEAIRLERDGKLGDALRAWRTLFGPLFPVG
ncbi:CBASS oligonucleotide cyclase [Luteitalea sp.]|uniref:CBASS oligonucleotide cyclase n=1 Tax=Luteitalea sp. TaxID=2004800 RepID=UPI0025B8B8C1|nr:CBASS oligonucleotide cyclase [Luteitalea sp.]